jgi:[ribosomal protein S5]-alanine N-acetyltransferase
MRMAGFSPVGRIACPPSHREAATLRDVPVLPARLETARLAARPPAPADARALLAVYEDADAVRWLYPDGVAPSVADMEHMVDVDLAHWRAHGFGRWVWVERDSGALVARCGPRLALLDRRADVEIHWSVRADRRRRGLAAEAAEAAIAACFDRLGVRCVTALTHVDNAASERVARAVGFGPERVVEHAGAPHTLHRRPGGGAP